jgi:hypothetical protein
VNGEVTNPGAAVAVLHAFVLIAAVSDSTELYLNA